MRSVVDDLEDAQRGLIVSSRQDGVGPVEISIDGNTITVDRSTITKVMAVHANIASIS